MDRGLGAVAKRTKREHVCHFGPFRYWSSNKRSLEPCVNLDMAQQNAVKQKETKYIVLHSRGPVQVLGPYSESQAQHIQAQWAKTSGGEFEFAVTGLVLSAWTNRTIYYG